MSNGTRYDIGELADLGGVSRRTVRFYVHEGLLPAPLGLGRGRHYRPEHLERLLQIKAMQERGLSLLRIRRALNRGLANVEPLPVPPRSSWTRIEVLPGVELHVSRTLRLPPPAKLAELWEWCRRSFRRNEEEGDA